MEIGGYIELERFHGSIYHDGAIALNCGRGCLAYLIAARQIEKMLVPSFLCDSVTSLCLREGVSLREYSVGEDLQPVWNFEVAEGEYLLLVDYYGQLTNESRMHAGEISFGRLIVDETQNYFALPQEGVDTLYTCRKYFGVPDGGFLYTDALRIEGLARGESRERVGYLIGRLERSAEEFYADAAANNESFADEPALIMSRFTENMLRAIDYERVIASRNANYEQLEAEFGKVNQLDLSKPVGPFAYPLLLEDGMRLKRELAQEGIFVPTLWPNVAEQAEDDLARRYARDILPLPVDQRYGPAEMDAIVHALKNRGVA